MAKRIAVVFSAIAVALCVLAAAPIALADNHEARLAALYEKVMLHGTGHFLHLERPEEVKQRIVTFLMAA